MGARNVLLSPWLLLSLFLVSLVGCGSDSRSTTEGSRPTAASRTRSGEPPIILISIDTLRADRLPVYGYKGGGTPAIDALRRDGILFERAYTSCPLTLPAHASLLTGLQPYTHGIRDNVGYRLESGTPSLPTWLKERGFVTGGAISTYVLRGETGLGALFDHYEDALGQGGDERSLGQVQRPGDKTRQRAEAWIAGHRQRPFFFLLHLFEPHTPYDPPEPFRSRFADPYDGEIAAADAVVGRFLEFLQQQGLYDRALIVLLSDHGEGLGDHGEEEHGIFLYPETIQVPLMVKLPAGERAGEAVATPAHLLDVFPTVRAWLGEESDPDLPGLNLLNLPSVSPEAPGRRLYSESYYARLHLGWSELRSLVDSRFQFIDAPRPELYDLLADPGARKDILSAERRVFRSMLQELDDHGGDLAAPTAVDDEEKARLAALGYLTAPAGKTDGPLPDPKAALPALEEMEQAFALATQGRCVEAVPRYRALLERFPAMLDARVELAACLRTLDQRQEALAEYSRALEASPQAAAGILISMADIQLELGRWEEAEDHARAALPSLPAKAHEALARVALGRGDAVAALQEARAAVAAEAVSRPSAALVLARAHLAGGDAAAALRELEALQSRLRAAGSGPEPWLAFLQGDALARLGRKPEAEAAFRNEFAAFPRHSQAFASLAVLLATQRRFGEIEPTLQAMVQAHPVPATYELAASTAERLGDSEGAARWRGLVP